MQAYTNYNTNSHLDYNAEQLRLPLDLSIEIDKNDPMWTFLEVIEEVNLNKYLKKRKGNQGHNNRMMLKTVLFAYMNRVFSLRHMEEKCRTDIRFMYLSEEEKPSFMAFQRFINNQLKASVSKIFTDITEIVCRKSGADTRILFLDGTMIEANANKFTFVWKKTAEKTLKKSLARVQEVIRSIEKETELKYEYKELTPDHLKGYAVKVLQYCLEKEISFVYGRGKRKTAIQRLYDELRKHTAKIEECSEKIEICGDDRSSYSKTDHDATFMHMKYDYYMNTGVFKPGYNIQLGESDEYIRHIRVGNDRTDSRTFIPFMEGYQKRYDELPGIIVADAGYGSYDNYMWCLIHQADAYIKYQLYEKEKTAEFRKQKYRKENLLHEENGKLLCPKGREFKYQCDKISTKTTYLSIDQIWECKTCNRCPYRKSCTKAKGNRKVQINVALDELRKAAKERLDSPAGKQLREQRCIQAEGTFGIIKNDWNYVRLHRRGFENVENEIYLVCIGFNLMKYHHKKLRKLLS